MNRPRIEIEWKAADWWMEGIAITIFVGTTLYILSQYRSLPDSIPTHFSFSGKADFYGPKSSIWWVVGINVALYGLLTGVARIPHHFNYLTEITNQNAKQQYTLSVQLIRYLKMVISCIFAYLSIAMIKGAQSETSSEVSSMFLPVALTLIVGGIIYYLIKMSSKK